ncbi:uncharacterized protein L969DRAFT_91809 [Mixia osmundae IAM 14324]|uniref:protein-histidine N-methyltransferase n=1 Tax=Mixia osmundae (strain CBS 9802 / IAM 14324 / JCM 22182 / KY 12970) TaxID=764103 RepID=G7EAK8_MIXOS|nr:uncharacterized protein L969DRAFT_91809 [Mixia osmundae IAM 14324]KEI42358.1 hypothetical protein L969DRAFT_91809 [Mixia osmundae IAM 14324]GAA99868.1 hypothetical protein E5Q_06571 [Mixia osmundae IAM 14324]
MLLQHKRFSSSAACSTANKSLASPYSFARHVRSRYTGMLMCPAQVVWLYASRHLRPEHSRESRQCQLQRHDMFKFDFDLPSDEAETPSVTPAIDALKTTTASKSFKEHSLDDLLADLPDVISFNTARIDSPNGQIELDRRDLYDARFQMLSDQQQSDAWLGEAVEAPTDLIPGVYEGGLKTWECSLDLVSYLSTLTEQPRSVLELGAGTALPACYVFQSLCRQLASGSQARGHRLHLQDYNDHVLRLMTLPNLLLAYARATSAPPAQQSDMDVRPISPTTSDSSDSDDEDFLEDGEPEETLNRENALELDDAFKAGFRTFLQTHNIELRFFSGDWSQFQSAAIAPEGHDLVLTSETIYNLDTLPVLTSLLRSSLIDSGRALVACKRIYFGVGGGMHDFCAQIDSTAGSYHVVWPSKGSRQANVARCILGVKWAK